MDRFRPNIITTGWPHSFAEDDARDYAIGGMRAAWVKPDIRCKVTMVDQATGEGVGPEPLRTLAQFRRDADDGGVSFGVKLRVDQTGRIAVGDAVDIDAARAPL